LLYERQTPLLNRKDFESALEAVPIEERKSIQIEITKLKRSQEKKNQVKQQLYQQNNKNIKPIYEEIISQILSCISGESSLVTIQATVVAILHCELNSIKNNQVTRTVIYIVQSDGDFLLGPFQGKLATQRIKKGSGIIGKSIMKKDIILESKEHNGADNIPKSEIAAPILIKNKPTAVLYLDSSLPGVFNENDRELLVQVVNLLKECRWTPLYSQKMIQTASSRFSLSRFLWLLIPTSVILSYIFRTTIRQLTHLNTSIFL